MNFTLPMGLGPEEPASKPDEEPNSRLAQTLPTRLPEDPSGESLAFQRLLRGQLDDLPERRSKTIRIFISSTFSDMHLERNVIMKNVYPKMKEFCRQKYGMAFQIADMRWGIQEGAALDHMATEICLGEIRSCMRLSAGPYFLAILGSRYGSRELPRRISERQFRALADATKSAPSVGGLLHFWYLEDTNCQPPVWELRPLSDAQLADRWRLEAPVLRSGVRRFLPVAMETPWQLSADEATPFTASVTHLELLAGLAQAPESRRRDALLLRREILDADPDDASEGPDARAALDRLKRSDLPALLPVANTATLRAAKADLLAGDGGPYAARFEAKLEQQLKRLVARAAAESDKSASSEAGSRLYAEVLHHACLCRDRGGLDASGDVSDGDFAGRDEALERIRLYLADSDSDEDGNPAREELRKRRIRYPLVVHGRSGSGKSALLARAACRLRSRWWPSKAPGRPLLLLARFLGTSVASSGLSQTLRLILAQLSACLGDSNGEIEDSFDSGGSSGTAVHRLSEAMFSMLARAGGRCRRHHRSRRRRVVLLLDALDQLEAAQPAESVAALLRVELPPGLRIVASVMSSDDEAGGLLAECRRLLLPRWGEEAFLMVDPLAPGQCCEIVRHGLLSGPDRRTLTPQQWRQLESAFQSGCSLPLFASLLLDEARRWRSHTAVSAEQLAGTVRQAIWHLFDRLERIHGAKLVASSLAYLTAARSGGLSEAELEDLLSLDNEVLAEVFSYHLPPLVRIPPLCWARLRSDLGHRLVEREADGAPVLAWHHRQFREAAAARYLEAEAAERVHSAMADYFLGVWAAGRAKPFSCGDALRRKLERAGKPVPTLADRRVPCQPLEFSPGRYNRRSLSELPHHLARSGRYRDFLFEVTFNPNYLQCRLLSSSLRQLMRDLSMLPAAPADAADVQCLVDALRISAPSLSHCRRSLGVELCGRLRQFAISAAPVERAGGGFWTASLVSRWRHRQPRPLLLPLTACLQSSCDPVLKCRIELPPNVNAAARLSSEGFCLVSSESGLDWRDFDDGDRLGDSGGSATSMGLPRRPPNGGRWLVGGPMAAAAALHCPELPASGCCCLLAETCAAAAATAKALRERPRLQLYRWSLRDGWCRALTPDGCEEFASLPASYLSSDAVCSHSGHNHMILQKPPTNSESEDWRCYAVVRAEPPRVLPRLLVRSRPGLCFSDGQFVFFHGSQSTVDCAAPSLLLLEEMELICLPDASSVEAAAAAGSRLFTVAANGNTRTQLALRLYQTAVSGCQLLSEAEIFLNDFSGEIYASLAAKASVAAVTFSRTLADSGTIGYLWKADCSGSGCVVQISGSSLLNSGSLSPSAAPVFSGDGTQLLGVWQRGASSSRCLTSWCVADGALLSRLACAPGTSIVGQQGDSLLVVSDSGRQFRVLSLQLLRRGYVDEVATAPYGCPVFLFDPKRDRLLVAAEPDGESVRACSAVHLQTGCVSSAEPGAFAAALQDYRVQHLRPTVTSLASGMRFSLDFQLEGWSADEELDANIAEALQRGIGAIACPDHPLCSSASSVSAASALVHAILPGSIVPNLMFLLLPLRPPSAPVFLRIDPVGRRVQQVARLPLLAAGRDILLGPGRAKRAAGAAGLARALRNCDDMMELMREADGHRSDDYCDLESEYATADSRGRAVAATRVIKGFLRGALESLSKSRDQSQFNCATREPLLQQLEQRLLEEAEQQKQRQQGKQESEAPGDFWPTAAEMAASALAGCEFEPRLNPQAECRPVAAWRRGERRVIVHARCCAEVVAAAASEDVCWPARLLTVGCASQHSVSQASQNLIELPECLVLSLSDSFDGEWVVPLPDGAACVTGRLKLLDTLTGRILRDLDPEDSVWLEGITLSADGRLLIGKSKSQLRVVQAYQLADGSRIFNYKYETEPLSLLLPRTDRVLALLPWQQPAVHVYEVLWDPCADGVEGGGGQCEEVTETQREDVTETQREDVTETQREDVTDTQREDVNETQRKDVTETQRKDVTETQHKDVTETQHKDVTETQRKDVTKTQSEVVTETQRKDVTETQSEDVTATKREEVTEIQHQDVTDTQREEVQTLKQSEAVRFHKQQSLGTHTHPARMRSSCPQVGPGCRSFSSRSASANPLRFRLNQAVAEQVDSDYFQGLRRALSLAMLAAVEERPPDPIEFVARSLLRFGRVKALTSER